MSITLDSAPRTVSNVPVRLLTAWELSLENDVAREVVVANDVGGDTVDLGADFFVWLLERDLLSDLDCFFDERLRLF